MLLSKSDQLVLAFVLACLGAAFILFLLFNLSFWVPESFPVITAVLFFLFLLLLARATKAERAIMFALSLVVAYIGSGVLDDRRVLLPLWVLPALAIIFLLLWSVLGFGVYREGRRLKFHSPLYKLSVNILRT